MSSSDKFPDWSIFSEREVPADIEWLSPISEVATLLQASHTALNTKQQALEDTRQEGLAALAQQAVFIFQLETRLNQYKSKFEEAALTKVYRSLRIIKDQMLDALRNVGLEIINPLGKSFDEVADLVTVVGWRHDASFTMESVVEVLEPIICKGNTVIRSGSVMMGASLTQATITTVVTNVEERTV